MNGNKSEGGCCGSKQKNKNKSDIAIGKGKNMPGRPNLFDVQPNS